MKKPETVKIEFVLNGKKVKTMVPATRTLLEMIRRDFGLTATKEGCGKGECGACTVIFNGKLISSCLKLAATLKPTDEVITLEALNENPVMKKIQQAFVEEGAIQCGFCTPGMVVSTFSLLQRNKKPSETEIKSALSGNLCRCTGYSKIIAAVKRASEEGGRK